MAWKLLFLFYFMIIGLNCDDATKESNTTKAEIPTDVVCDNCECIKTTIDCKEKGLEQFFTTADWAGVKSMSPRVVTLSYNKFNEITPFIELPIRTLDLSHCQINKIQIGSFKSLQNMTMLDLSFNNLSTETLIPDIFLGKYMPEEYTPLRSMRILNLSNNNLHSLNPDVFEHLPELSELRLSGNPLVVIDHPTVIAISSIPLLKVLDLRSCQLKSLPEHIFHTPKYLEWLDLSANEFNNVPEELEEAKALKYLSLSENPIKYIEKNSKVHTAFHPLPNLEELHLCKMPYLTEIGGNSMSGFDNLKIVYINFNPALSKINGTAFETAGENGEKYGPLVKELYINKNNLSMIENSLIGRWDLLEKIDIRHNPFLCDCSTQWMVSTLAPIVIHISGNMTSDIICHEPIEMRGKSMIHLEEIHSHMRCSDLYNNRPEKDGIFLVGTLIGVLITIPVLLGLMLLYKKGYISFCGSQGPAAFSRQFYRRADTDNNFY